METKHTKGQWQAQTTKPFIAKVVAFRNGDKLEITQSATNLSDEEADANAKLIAAAPELLEALIKSKARYEDENMTHLDEYFLICNAIKKAKGE